MRRFHNTEGTDTFCFHSPSKASSPLRRFIDYFLYLNKFYSRFDNTSHCAWCGTVLLTPIAFSHPLLKTIYFGISVFVHLLYFYFANHFFYTEPFAILIGWCIWFYISILFFHRVISALTFSLCRWIPYDEGEYDADRFWKKARNNRGEIVRAVLLGSLFFTWIARNMPGSFFVGISSLIGLWISLYYKDLVKISIFSFALFYSVAVNLISLDVFIITQNTDAVISFVLLFSEVYMLLSLTKQHEV